MSKKLTKKQLAKANKVTGGRAIYGYGIKTGNAEPCCAHKNSSDHNGVVIVTGTKKATKKGTKGQVVVP